MDKIEFVIAANQILKRQSSPPPALMSIDDIASACQVSRRLVEQWRSMGKLPEPVKLPGSRLVRFRREDVEAWIANFDAAA